MMNRHLPERQRAFQPEGRHLQSTGGAGPHNLWGKAASPLGLVPTGKKLGYKEYFILRSSEFVLKKMRSHRWM